jgi:hypothetical protein
MLTHISEELIAFITLIMKAVSTSEMSISFYQTTQHNITVGSHLHISLRTCNFFFLQVENNTLPFLEGEEEETMVHVMPIKQEVVEEKDEMLAGKLGLASWSLHCTYEIQ